MMHLLIRRVNAENYVQQRSTNIDRSILFLKTFTLYIYIYIFQKVQQINSFVCFVFHLFKINGSFSNILELTE